MTYPMPSSEVLSRLDAVLADLRGRRIGVLGLGIAGRAMALLLRERGAQVIGVDKRADLSDAELLAAGVELRLGDAEVDTFQDVEALVVSPGADPRQPAVAVVAARGVPILGELELVGALEGCVIGITGTNGKSTTTALTGALLESLGHTAFVGGNFGEPVASFVRRAGHADALVLELSSYQLETAYHFAADVGVVLNVTPDHLDRYDGLESYAAAKARLVENLAPRGVAVLNHDDVRVREMGRLTRGRVWWLSTSAKVDAPHAAWLEGDTVRATGDLKALEGFDLAHPRLLGRHNRENAIAALAAVVACFGEAALDVRALQEGYRRFGGLAHRLEVVDEVEGVLYINDTKATNDDAAAIALGAMTRPTLVLVGGRDKGGGYERLRGIADKSARLVIAYGEAKSIIARAFSTHPGLREVATFDEAFDLATAEATAGEVVLLAPACSSFDEFTNYAARGEHFRARVAALAGGRR